MKGVLQRGEFLKLVDSVFVKEILRDTREGFLGPILHPNYGAAVDKRGKLSACVSQSVSNRGEANDH